MTESSLARWQMPPGDDAIMVPPGAAARATACLTSPRGGIESPGRARQAIARVMRKSPASQGVAYQS